MDAVSDDLTKPLGVNRPEPRAWLAEVAVGHALAGVAIAVIGALSVYLAFASDPLGGEPHAVVTIERAGPTGEVSAALRPDRGAAHIHDPQAPSEPRTRSSALDVEAASGVSVVRPEGAAPPSSVIIQVPETLSGGLKAAPDQRLVERSRYGLLPQIGPDGARPAKVYARPPEGPTSGAAPPARVALLVAGLGISQATTADAIAKLPAPVTLAFAPYGSDLERHVAAARHDGHEVMLQIPMEPFDYPDNDPGPQTLTVRAKGPENISRLHWSMARFTGYVGVVNFMGAKLTSDEIALAPILREIGSRGLVFLDDGSSSRSLATQIGASTNTPTGRADIVLDGVPRPEPIDRQLERLEQLARQRGFAIGTASALPVTLDRVAQWARTLEARGVLLVPVSSIFHEGARR